jgi:hypothetical protein
MINKDTNNNKILLGLIDLIISKDQYLKNLQYQYFLEKLLEREICNKSGMFDEFGDKYFNEYYSNMISKRKNGNLFFIDVFDAIKNILFHGYEKENKKINGEQLNEGLLYKLSLFYRQNKIN